ncbi:hypothetical protein [Polaribacter cellanae]|uniref:Uncharacterized protein n=1 Tax=Polaribacter cellanae TaxID=2818493 RepID=A0A975H879_9FLAO|nr:hypothetical protein [Polaribacter cellanae]QTE21315.1 hypothetical protein J3359_10790 [Polaribacter cellanae]
MRNSIFSIAIIFNLACLSQEKQKDSLFIKFDKSLIDKVKEQNKNSFYYKIKDCDKKEDLVYFLEKKKYYNLKVKKVKCLKEVLKKSNAGSKKNKIDDLKLAKYLSDFLVFFVRRNEFIKVETSYSIE